MFTRTSSALALVLLAGCQRAPAEATPAKAQGDDSLIACALNGARDFTPECGVDRVRGAHGLELVVRHPDGGFRRFDVLTDGHGLATADGAQAAAVSLREGGIEVAVGADRYRFPATIAAHGQ